MESVGGIPVECLTGELAGVWSGWRNLGDREVVREASAKGTHINLAQKCLATRRNCSLIDSQIYFYREVDVWVEELLDKQQVFRATHIIKNVGKDPKEKINSVCINSKNPILTDYLIKHLEKVEGGLEKPQIEAWELIKFMENYKLRYSISDDPITHKSIKEIIAIPEDEKNVLYTDLYFHTLEHKIVSKLSDKVVWDYLLMKNDIDSLYLWIDVNYIPNHEGNITHGDTESLKSVFKDLKITDNMIDSVQQSNATDIVKELVLNRLASHGVFSSKESKNVKTILTRLFNNKIPPSKFEEAITQPFSTIKPEDFFPKLNIDLYSKSYLEENRILEIDGKRQRLCASLESMTNSLDIENSLQNGILDTVDYLSDDVIKYLKENPTILLTVVLLNLEKGTRENISGAKKNLTEIFSAGQNGLKINDSLTLPKEIVRNLLISFPHIEKAIGLSKNRIQDSTMYQLLNGFQNFNSNRAFIWRQKTSAQIPTFANEYLVRKYGHKEKLSYINYLKQGRPNMAARLLIHDQRKFHSDISSKMKCRASTEAHICALRNLDRREITSACVSFIEIIGVDSENLRLHLSVAKRIREELNTPIGELLEAVMYNNPTDLKTLTSYLERCFKLRITESLDEHPEQLISAIKDWDLIIRFSRAHNTSLPDTFPEYFARKDLWFEFLLVGQIYAYPIDQMIKIAKKISNPNIKGHILACLSNKSLFKPHRESQTPKTGITPSDSKNASSPDSVNLVSGFSGDNENSMFSSTDDLWLTILKSHQSQDPPGSLLRISRFHRSPLLIVLASCYEPSSIPAYWCSWLVISTDDSKVISDYQDSLDRQVWSSESVMKLLKLLVASGYTKTMSRGLEIFMPDNPLFLFADFLNRCTNFGDFESGKDNLRAFKIACSNLVCNINVGWNDTDLLCLKNSYWIYLVAIKCAFTALAHSFNSRDSQLEFIKALSSCDFSFDLPDSPDFNRLLKVVEILNKTQVTMNFGAVSSSEDWNTLENELRRCLSELTESENYKAALELCRAASLDSSDTIISQWRKEFIKNTGMTNFWKNCDKDFRKYNVGYEVAAPFYVEHAEKVVSHNERYEILKLAHQTLKGTMANPEIIDGVEMAMWKSCFLADPDNLKLDEEESPVVLDKLKTELMSGLTELKVRCDLVEPEEKVAVEKLIDKFIDAGNLNTALRIATIFNCKHRDLHILMLCLSLAEGEISPYELTEQQKMLLTIKTRLKNQWQVGYRGKGLQKVSSINSISQNPLSDATELATEIGTDVSDNSVLEKQDRIHCITQLEKLVENLSHGVKVGRKILLCYKLSTHLNKSYQSLLTLNNPIEFLNEISSQNQFDYKIEVIKDVVAAYQVSNRLIAEFLASKIVDTITQHIEGNNVDQPISIWGYTLDGNFHMITELCGEPSLIGLKLLECVSRLLGRSYGENRDVNTLKVIVELIIKSHDCFTASCNMEGIASILRKSQQLSNSLQNLKQWGLLVRLLTGVGRFTEMNYILQILKENEQFEFLLTGKGLEKIPGLKTALLDFLKRNCPEDKDLFNLVAHHFRLYSEIASTFEKEAKEMIDKLLNDAKNEARIQGVGLPTGVGDLKLTKNESTENKLRLAMTNYTHAAEYYLQDSKLNLAYQCCHRAELVALQTSFFISVNQNQQVSSVLNLNGSEIDKMIANDLSFAQANILLRAYNHPVDWGSVIYNHCVLKSDSKYLKDFTNINELSVNIVKDSAKRFQLEKSITKQMADSMQQLVSLVKDVECKYTLASQLGFKNIIENILSNPTITAYLKDTVWRKGYSSTAFE